MCSSDLVPLARIADSVSAINIDTTIKNYHSQMDSQFIIKNCTSGDTIISYIKIKKDRLGFRSSVSDYAYSSKSYLFGMLYCMAAMLYIYNGFVYLKRRNNLKIQKSGHRYNVIIGLCLIGVILNPESDNVLLHNLFSILFFVGNICVMLFFPKQYETKAFKVTRITMAFVTVIVLLGTLGKLYSILWAEWISLFVIGSYLILVANSAEKTDYNQP